MSETTVRVADMSCGHCVASVQTALENTAGVTGVEVHLDTKLAHVSHGVGLDISALERAIQDVGFTPEVLQ
jgi:copper chaperone CopZ